MRRTWLLDGLFRRARLPALPDATGLCQARRPKRCGMPWFEVPGMLGSLADGRSACRTTARRKVIAAAQDPGEPPVALRVYLSPHVDLEVPAETARLWPANLAGQADGLRRCAWAASGEAQSRAATAAGSVSQVSRVPSDAAPKTTWVPGSHATVVGLGSPLIVAKVAGAAGS